jgi:hypothetical protein
LLAHWRTYWRTTGETPANRRFVAVLKPLPERACGFESHALRYL